MCTHEKARVTQEKAGDMQLSIALLTWNSVDEGGGEPLSSHEVGGQVQWPRITGIGALRGGPEALPNQPGSLCKSHTWDTAT